MLDIKLIRNNPDILKNAMAKRKENFDVDELLKLDEKRRKNIAEVESLKYKQNESSKLIPVYKKEGKDVNSLLEEMKNLSEKIKVLDAEAKNIDEKLNEILLTIPNIPNETVPPGDSDEDNVEVRRWGEPTKFDFVPKPHWEIGKNLDILDPSTASKVTGQDLCFIRVLVHV